MRFFAEDERSSGKNEPAEGTIVLIRLKKIERENNRLERKIVTLSSKLIVVPSEITRDGIPPFLASISARVECFGPLSFNLFLEQCPI